MVCMAGATNQRHHLPSLAYSQPIYILAVCSRMSTYGMAPSAAATAASYIGFETTSRGQVHPRKLAPSQMGHEWSTRHVRSADATLVR